MFRQTLLDAKSITYFKEGASTIHLVGCSSAWASRSG